MSDANLATLAYGEETTLGTLPTPAALKELPYTRESLNFAKETQVSQQIRPDRQTPDSQKVFGAPQGGFDFELTYKAILPFLAAAMQADWQTINLTASIAIDHTTGVLTGAAGDFDDVPVGALIKIAGASTAGNNGLHRTTAKASDGSTLTVSKTNLTATDAAASLTLTGKTISNGVTRKSMTFEKRLLNSEGADFYQRYRGMVLDTLELSIESKRLVTGSASFVGTVYQLGDSGSDASALDPVAATGTLTLTGNATEDETVTVGGTVYTFKAAPAGDYEVDIGIDASTSIDNLIAEITGNGTGPAHPDVTAAAGAGDTMDVEAKQAGAAGNAIATTTTMADGTWGDTTLTGGVTQTGGYDPADESPIVNGTNNLGTINLDGAEASDRFKAITLRIANNVRGKDAAGVEGNWDIGLGSCQVSGNFNAYFRDNTLPTRIKDHTTFSLEFHVEDAEGNRLYFYLPAVKPDSGDPAITGINTDVMLQTDWNAIKSSAAENQTGKTVIVDAIAAP